MLSKTIGPRKKKPDDAKVVDIQCFQYNADGRILDKFGHNENWNELVVLGNSTQIRVNQKASYQNKRYMYASKISTYKNVNFCNSKRLN